MSTLAHTSQPVAQTPSFARPLLGFVGSTFLTVTLIDAN